jgi:integrase/recombinase XerD
MTLGEVIDAYLALQRARGVRFEEGRALLSQFRREMGDPPIDHVCAEAVVNFLQGRGALSATWLLKDSVLSGLYRFAIGRGRVDMSPLPMATPPQAASPANPIRIFERRVATVAGRDDLSARGP